MTLDADQIVDRRRLARRLTVWRVIAFGFALIALLAIIAVVSGDLLNRAQPHIARVTVSGTILEDPKRDEMLAEIARSSSVRAVIVSIESPGGTTTGAEALYTELRLIAEEKPVVATIRTIGTSAAYAAAIAADHVIARETSITGSIGVLFQWANFGDLMDTIGIDVDSIKSDPLKAEPSPFDETTPEERAVIRALIDDSYDWFLGIVADRRGLDREQARTLADGRIYSGRAAVDNGLIDAIGGEREARAWLTEEYDINTNLDVIDWEPGDEFAGLALGARALRALGLDDLLPTAPALDGLISVWHPQLLED
ncbi:MAG: signal peptide peptidase SppA [Pseudomonadota bacterium]